MLATQHEMNRNKYDYQKYLDDKRNKLILISKIEKSIIQNRNKNEKLENAIEDFNDRYGNYENINIVNRIKSFVTNDEKKELDNKLIKLRKKYFNIMKDIDHNKAIIKNLQSNDQKSKSPNRIL